MFTHLSRHDRKQLFELRYKSVKLDITTRLNENLKEEEKVAKIVKIAVEKYEKEIRLRSKANTFIFYPDI